MREKFINYIKAPISKQDLNLIKFQTQDNQITAGLLINKQEWFPIINGIPRMLVKELRKQMLRNHLIFYRTWLNELPLLVKTEWQEAVADVKDYNKFIQHQEKTGASFAFEWKNIYQENNFEKQNFLHFIGPHITANDLKGKTVVDIGCGSGRFTKQAVVCGANIAFGTDLGESVEVAYEMTKGDEHICIIQADIYCMPFFEIFDYAYSIGVLHHLPQPQVGFSSLVKLLKSGGQMIIWVYNRRHNRRALYIYEPIRSVMKFIPKKVLLKLCYIPALIVEGFNGLTKVFQKIGNKKLGNKIPFSYYANFPFSMKLNDSFDVLATPKSNYYFVEEIEDWFRQSGFQSIKSYEHPEAGITCQGTKRVTR
ncbi:MAG: methyltransferase domain-containing protein [Patescibacteria group bacterium]|jgi:2-polyprenyl-3-methyl-5-hydroxy-6-metoxy-1,4-benzoquinol methylase/uncharacterized protein YbaR (Trm112 family)